MPGNDLADKEVSRTDEQRQLAGLTERSGNVAQEQLCQRIITRNRRADRRRRSDGVYTGEIAEHGGLANVFIRLAQDSATIARAASAGLMKF